MPCCVPGCPKLLQNWAIEFPSDGELREHWKRAIEVGTGQRLSDDEVVAGAVCDMHFTVQLPNECYYQEPTLFVRDNVLIRVTSCRLCLRHDRSDNMFNTTDGFGQGYSLQSMVDRYFTQSSSGENSVPTGDAYFCERCTVRIDMTHTFWLEINDGVALLERLLQKRSKEKQVLAKKDCTMAGKRGKRRVATTNKTSIGHTITREPERVSNVNVKKEKLLVESEQFPMVQISEASNLRLHEAAEHTEHLNSTIVKEESRLADSNIKHKVAERLKAKQFQKNPKNELDCLEPAQERDTSQDQPQQNQDESSDSSKTTDSLKRRRGKVYRCGICGIKFASRREEFIHRHVHPEDAIKPKHLAVRTGGPGRNLPMCNLCKSTFASPAEVVDHFKDVHPKVKFKTFACPTCGEIFFRNPPLYTHQYLHTDTYACEECGKRHECKQHLDHHRNTAHGVPLNGYYYIKCPVCDLQLKRKSFTKHMRTHSDEKEFSCDLCEKRFRERTQLRQHQRTHTGVKPLVCPTCGKGFATSGSFCKHKKKCLEKSSS